MKTKMKKKGRARRMRRERRKGKDRRNDINIVSFKSTSHDVPVQTK